MKAVLAPALAFALVLTGCGSGSRQPTASPSPSVATSVPTPTVSEDPKAVLERVVREYYTQANRALATGDVSGLVARTSERCSCRGLVRYIQGKYAKGSIRGGLFIVRSVRPIDVQPTRAVVQVVQDAASFEILDRTGTTIERGAAEPNNTDDFYLVQVGGRWIVDNVVGVK